MTKTRVLIPLDGSETSQQILSVVCRFFGADAAEVTLLQVTQPFIDPVTELYLSPIAVPLPESQRWQTREDAQAAWQEQQQTIRERLEREADGLRNMGYTVHVAVRAGNPVEEIVRHVQESQIDLIAMATHGRKGLSRLLMGSVAEEVLRMAAVPVLLDRPAQEDSLTYNYEPQLYVADSR